jgi:hypothetical protein
MASADLASGSAAAGVQRATGQDADSVTTGSSEHEHDLASPTNERRYRQSLSGERHLPPAWSDAQRT